MISVAVRSLTESGPVLSDMPAAPRLHLSEIEQFQRERSYRAWGAPTTRQPASSYPGTPTGRATSRCRTVRDSADLAR